jgi:hypothetical protein
MRACADRRTARSRIRAHGAARAVEGAVGPFDQPVQRVALGQAVDPETGGVGLALHERQIHQMSLTRLWRNRSPNGAGPPFFGQNYVRLDAAHTRAAS